MRVLDEAGSEICSFMVMQVLGDGGSGDPAEGKVSS